MWINLKTTLSEVIKSIVALFNLSLKCLRIFPELSSKGLCLSLDEEKEDRCPVFTFSMKREILSEKLGSFTS